jgi:hypothetical protein
MGFGNFATDFAISARDFRSIMQRLTEKYKCSRYDFIESNSRFVYNDLFVAPQEYTFIPSCIQNVYGASSQTIYNHMMGYKTNNFQIYTPHDCDDYERNRALLLHYPQWSERIKEMSSLSKRWKLIAENWIMITELYNQDKKLCEKFFRYLDEKIKLIHNYEDKPKLKEIKTIPAKALFLYMNKDGFCSENIAKIIPKSVTELRDIFELLSYYPSWKERITELNKYPKWKKIIDNWNLMESLIKDNEELCSSLLLELIK